MSPPGLTALPKAPEIVLGIINVRGRIVPVVDTRRRFGLPARETNLSDHLIIARTSRRAAALLADGLAGVVQHPRAAITPTEQILRNLEYERVTTRHIFGSTLEGQPIRIAVGYEQSIAEFSRMRAAGSNPNLTNLW